MGPAAQRFSGLDDSVHVRFALEQANQIFPDVSRHTEASDCLVTRKPNCPILTEDVQRQIGIQQRNQCEEVFKDGARSVPATNSLQPTQGKIEGNFNCF